MAEVVAGTEGGGITVTVLDIMFGSSSSLVAMEVVSVSSTPTVEVDVVAPADSAASGGGVAASGSSSATAVVVVVVVVAELAFGWSSSSVLLGDDDDIACGGDGSPS